MLPDTLLNFTYKLISCYEILDTEHSDDVKCALFQTYCTNRYCCQLRFNSTKSSINNLSSIYNSVLRCLLCFSKPYSARNIGNVVEIYSQPERNLNISCRA